MEKALVFDQQTQQAIFSKSDAPYGKEVTMAGWGAINEQGIIPSSLRKTTTSIRTDQDCKNSLGSVYSNHVLCFSGTKTIGGDGDSGGPVVSKDGTLLGIFVGDKTEGNIVISIAVRVSMFYDWIHSLIDNDDDDYCLCECYLPATPISRRSRRRHSIWLKEDNLIT